MYKPMMQAETIIKKGRDAMLKPKNFFVITAVCAALFISLPHFLYAAAETEPNDNMTQADPLNTGTDYSGQLSSCADQDWFSVTTYGPDTIQISTHHTNDLWICFGNYLQITVYDGSSNTLANVVALNCGRDFDVGVEVGGTYYIVITPDQVYDACPTGVTQPYTVSARWSTRPTTSTTVRPTTTSTIKPSTTTSTTTIGEDCNDNDGDGYGINCDRGTDCNDNNPHMNPGIYEICDDHLDNDCDGLTDEQDCVHECLFVHLLGDESPAVANLRFFRDTTLSQSLIGRKIIQIYYNNADSINDALERSPALRAAARRILEMIAPMVGEN